jgi:hypothetical protein
VPSARRQIGNRPRLLADLIEIHGGGAPQSPVRSAQSCDPAGIHCLPIGLTKAGIKSTKRDVSRLMDTDLQKFQRAAYVADIF